MPGRATLASTQVEYSLLNRDVEAEVLPAAEALGLGVLPWSPLGRGRAHRQVPARHAQRTRAPPSPHFSGFVEHYLNERTAGVVEAVAGPPTAWAGRRCRWRWSGCATGPGVVAPIVGARTAAQLQAALAVEELTLPDEIIAALDDVSGD